MPTITIPKKEYQELVEKKLKYEYMRSVLAEDIFSPPPTRNTKEIMRAFASAKKYNREFLASLRKGMKRSAYFSS